MSVLDEFTDEDAFFAIQILGQQLYQTLEIEFHIGHSVTFYLRSNR